MKDKNVKKELKLFFEKGSTELRGCKKSLGFSGKLQKHLKNNRSIWFNFKRHTSCLFKRRGKKEGITFYREW